MTDPVVNDPALNDPALNDPALNDREAVVATAMDYFAGWYDADPARIDRALHAQLVKRSSDQAGGPSPNVTTKERMLQLVGAGGGAEDRTDDPIEVTVVDIHHDIAAAVVRSRQYREYLHLVRTTEGWRIVDALWSFSDPRPPA